MTEPADSSSPAAGRYSLQWRLPILVSALVLIVLGTFLWAAYREVERSLLHAAGERAQTSADQVVGLLGPQFLQRFDEVRRAAADPALRHFLQNPIAGDRHTAEQPLRALGGQVRVDLWSTSGERLLTVFAGETGGPGAAVDRPMPAGPGVAVFEESTAVFWEAVIDVLGEPDAPGDPKSGPARRGYLVSRRLISLTPPDILGRLVGSSAVLIGPKVGGAWTNFAAIVSPPSIDISQSRGVAEYRAPDGAVYMGALAEISGTPFTTWVEFPRAAVLVPASTFLLRMSALTLLFVVVAVVLARTLMGRITTPLVGLSRAADAIAAGDYSRRAEIDRRDEIGRLATSFNVMASHVEESDAALVESERAYRSTFDEAPVGIAHTSLEGRVLRANARVCALLGYGPQDAPITDLPTLTPAEERGQESEGRMQLLSGALDQVTWEGRMRRRDGDLLWVKVTLSLHRDSAGRPAYFIAIIDDISQRRLLEEQLRQAHKMEAVGRLAGGVAHDFNNLLTAILGFSALVLEDLPAGHPSRDALLEIKHAGESAASLTRQLLAFSRQQILQLEVLDLNAVVRRMDALLQRVLGEDIRLVPGLAPSLGSVNADAAQIEQIILNLAINARDAMPQGGQLTIETANVMLDEEHTSRHRGAKPGLHVMLAVSDTGVGMSEATQAQIFEPFFTTKKRGEGTGLGLATVYGIVKQSGGWIWVYSELGHGTTFKLYFPITSQEVPSVSRSPESKSLEGRETILLAEDQPEVRSVAIAVLTRHGYAVLEAKSGAQAIQIARATHSPIDLLLTDVVMPSMSGRQLAELLHAERPDLRVLYASGYADDAIVHHGVLEAGVGFLQKPFTPQGLLEKVREVLDAPYPPAGAARSSSAASGRS